MHNLVERATMHSGKGDQLSVQIRIRPQSRATVSDIAAARRHQISHDHTGHRSGWERSMAAAHGEAEQQQSRASECIRMQARPTVSFLSFCPTVPAASRVGPSPVRMAINDIWLPLSAARGLSILPAAPLSSAADSKRKGALPARPNNAATAPMLNTQERASS